MKLTFEMVQSCYENADLVSNGEKTFDEAIKYLTGKDLGMNERTARYYINAYLCMRKGETYTMTINVMATEFYLGNILNKYGKEELRKALTAVKGQIDYYSKSSSRKKLPTIEFAYEMFSIFLD